VPAGLAVPQTATWASALARRIEQTGTAALTPTDIDPRLRSSD
jgi:hypothetical protein